MNEGSYVRGSNYISGGGMARKAARADGVTGFRKGVVR
jgi:hypothetical protein